MFIRKPPGGLKCKIHEGLLKIMRSNTAYKKELEQAKANLADVRKRGADAICDNALDLMRELLTPEEIATSNLKVSIMLEE